MIVRLWVLLLLAGPAAAAQPAPSSAGWLDIEIPDDRPAASEENIAEGRRLYDYRCSPCHGVKGDGKGPTAKTLDPRPRDFTLGNFKFRTTKFGEVPLDEDMYRTITRGVPGSAMPAWTEPTLTPAERFQIIYYIKSLPDVGEWFELDPRREEDGERFLVDVPGGPTVDADLVARGKEVFHQGKCIECHGLEGRGDGTSAGTQYNYLKQRILPRDLTKGWRYKAGTSVRDIWRALTSGLNGTPMPSFIGSLHHEDAGADEADRWAVSAYVNSLIVKQDHSEETVLDVKKVSGALPDDPDDAAWDDANEIHFRLIGQVTMNPRWQIATIDHVRVRALYNDTDIAFRLEYHDRTESTVHEDAEPERDEGSYPELDVTEYAWKTTKYADAMALQFPAKPPLDAEKPYFLYGQLDKPVTLWRFRADRPEDAPIEQLVAKGPGKVKPDAEGTKQLSGKAIFAKGEDQKGKTQGLGRWRVVMKRPLLTDGKMDAQFTPGAYIPFVVHAWDGGNGEAGLRQSISSWYYLRLEAPIPRSAYTYGAGAVLLVVLLELIWLLRIRKKDRRVAARRPAEQAAA